MTSTSSDPSTPSPAAQPNSLTLGEAETLLRRFICLDRLPASELPDPALVRQAIRLTRDYSDYQIFGICADTVAEAQTALMTYLTALNYPDSPTIPAFEGTDGVYLKYNPATGRCLLDAYVGQHRGVLVSCQSADLSDVNETFGHLPLDLFAAPEPNQATGSTP